MVNPQTETTPFAGCLARMFWMIGGLVVLIFISLAIFRNSAFSIYDIAFAVIVMAMILVRLLDIRYLRGETADGQPATIRDWRRYAVRLAASSAGFWAVLHGVAWIINK